ncbi:hypothetical protein BDV98DRAFT_169959 [Pterulicium gracile]|uniref:Uncharacterized protein n=1 Tax=Pterulicium gracile TaxID=1884261 RepID=A0A5C3QBT5_9AGAR|nr:hypothetical protein BDV98DRAFT_169959 [Pterula gracilis]
MDHQHRTVHADVSRCDRAMLSYTRCSSIPVASADALGVRPRHLVVQDRGFCLCSEKPHGSEVSLASSLKSFVRRHLQKPTQGSRPDRPEIIHLLDGLVALPRLQELTLALDCTIPVEENGDNELPNDPCQTVKNDLLPKSSLAVLLHRNFRYSTSREILPGLNSSILQRTYRGWLSSSIYLWISASNPRSNFPLNASYNHLTKLPTLELHGTWAHAYFWESLSSMPTLSALKVLRVSVDKGELELDIAGWQFTALGPAHERLSYRHAVFAFLQRYPHIEDLTLQYHDPAKHSVFREV